ncbi:MAG: glucoamylase family protein [Bryobacteraceae bacterium]
MNPQELVSEHATLDLAECRAAGRALARSVVFEDRRVTRAPKLPKASYVDRMIVGHPVPRESLRLLTENFRLIRTTEIEVREFTDDARSMPVFRDESGTEVIRVVAAARGYLDTVRNRFSEETLAAFLDGFQDQDLLEMRELWALKIALYQEMLERLTDEPILWPNLLYSLRQVHDLEWKDLFEAVNRLERLLNTDPVGAYAGMDFESRESYRRVVGELASRSNMNEREIVEAALAMARDAHAASDGSRAAVRRAHVGYYFVDGGIDSLRKMIGYRLTLREHFTGLLTRWPTAFYLIGMELVTYLVVIGMLTGLDSLTPIFAGLLLLIIPATQAGVDFINNLIVFLVPPRTLPRLDFSRGIPADCATMVAVPTLLLNEAQVRDLVLDLEIRFLANRDPNLYFALLTDCPDSDRPFDERDALVDLCRDLIKGLNRRYQNSFFLLHRNRVYNEKEGCWMGWERKRGKLLDLNSLIRGAFDAFPVKAGDVSVLPRIRYVITLDSDTQLPRDSAARLIGTLAHPLNAAVIDPGRHIVSEGYGILQPRIGVSIHSAARSRLAAIYSGEAGFDIYTHAVSDVYQDLFGEGSFTGKGIYEVETLHEVLQGRFPENALLSHDLIEGAYARAGLVSDIELIDDYPSHFSAYSRRKHRWVRGDWQTLRWLLDRVPDRTGSLSPNPTSVISRWKIVDNLRRSLLEPSLMLLFLGAWFMLPGRAGYWTAAAAALLFIPGYWAFLFSVFRTPLRPRAMRAWLRKTFQAFADANASGLFTLIFLLHQALISVDAIVRSILRMFVTGHKMLEWETSAEAEAARKSKATVDVYLEWTPLIGAALALLVWRLRPASLSAAAPMLVLWAGSRVVSAWLNRPPRTANSVMRRADVDWLREQGLAVCRYFRDWSNPTTHWLIPDYVREDGEAAMTLSPTNVGMLLNSRIAALHLGAITLAEFVSETTYTLNTLAALPKHRGHLFNWYDITTLQPSSPLFVSTVDSGNLAASLWTLRQAALAFAAEPPAKRSLTPQISTDLTDIAAVCDRLVRDTDFGFLYDTRRKVLSVGFDVTAGRVTPSYYDLLASESRVATFIAIAKGDIPQEAWFHLGRGHRLFEGERILLSWTGTMFEYLMPVIWMRHYPGTITHNSVRGAVKAQREYARHKGIPWGISESAYLQPDGSYGYAPFGIPELSLKRPEGDTLVVSPYSSFLAATVDPASSLKNLRQIEQYGWTGRYGFYEAVDYTHSGGQPIRSWMAHHQGMSLAAICNVLFDQPLQRYFHAEPHVMATELLLHERIPAAMEAEREDPAPVPEIGPATVEAA